MKTCTRCKIEQEDSLFGKNKYQKDGLHYQCKECSIFYNRISKAKNKHKYVETARQYDKSRTEKKNLRNKQKYASDEQHRERMRALHREWVANNKSKFFALKKKWEVLNRDLINERKRDRYKNDDEYRNAKNAQSKKWLEENKWYRNYKYRSYQIAKQHRLPKWLSNDDLMQIKSIYYVAKRQSLVVDHIIPLRGKYVSGLHVPQNLQIIDRLSNAQKSNKFDIDKEWRT